MWNNSYDMKKNIITFEASSNHVFEVREKPIPAVKIIPDWWKNKSKDYTLDDIFYLDSVKRKRLIMEVNHELKR